MIQTTPGTYFDALCVGFDSGLVGTIGVQIVDDSDNTVYGRTINGITENPPASGIYHVNLLSPVDKGNYLVQWDTGVISRPTVAIEELEVTDEVEPVFSVPGDVYESIARGFPTGLVGTIGYQVLDMLGNVIIPRTTAGIIELGPGIGAYQAEVIVPVVTGTYTILWDDGAVTPGNIAVDTFVVYASQEILASLSDINANLDGTVVSANAMNTALLQISVARIVRGYLSRVFTRTQLLAWDIPEHTPEIIREVAGKLIASQLYFNKTATQSLDVDENSFAQMRYNEAMQILKDLVSGEQVISGLTTELETTMSELDFFPRDSTDRSFTKSLQF
jgi:hypothetical protein